MPPCVFSGEAWITSFAFSKIPATPKRKQICVRHVYRFHTDNCRQFHSFVGERVRERNALSYGLSPNIVIGLYIISYEGVSLVNIEPNRVVHPSNCWKISRAWFCRSDSCIEISHCLSTKTGWVWLMDSHWPWLHGQALRNGGRLRTDRRWSWTEKRSIIISM